MATDTTKAAEGAEIAKALSHATPARKKQAQVLRQADMASALAGTSQSFRSSTHGGRGGKGGKQKSTPVKAAPMKLAHSCLS